MRLGVEPTRLELFADESASFFRVLIGGSELLKVESSASHPGKRLGEFGRRTALGLVGANFRFGNREIILREGVADIFHNPGVGGHGQKEDQDG
jgi:hypothetical protein